MNLTPSHTCDICGKAKGGPNHATCSKTMQAQHANDKRTRKVKTLNDSHAKFISKLTETK